MRISNAVFQNKKFGSRVITSNIVNNGQSSNWRHDWFKFNKKSYSEVVQSVSKNKFDQVDNYPWNSSVLKGGGVNKSQVTNRESVSNKAQVINTKQRLKCDPNGHMNGQTRGLVNVNRKDVIVKNKARSDMKTKVRSSIVTIPCAVSPHTSPGSHSACASQNNMFTPLVHNNRFWPVTDLSLNQEEKVVIDEVQTGMVCHEGKKAKKVCNQINAHTDTVKNDLGQSDMVGGDSSRVSMSKTLNALVHERPFLVSTANVDKYDLTLRFKSKYEDKIEQAANSDILKLWDEQTVGKFGYIPLTEQAVGEKQQISQVNSDLLQVHEKVKQTGTHNLERL